MELTELTDQELRYLDQVGELPLTAEYKELITAVEVHALSLTGPHKILFLEHLKSVNPALARRVLRKEKEYCP